MIIPLVLLCCFTVGCISRDEAAAVDVEADIQAIRDSIAELNAVVNAGDTDSSILYINSILTWISAKLPRHTKFLIKTFINIPSIGR